MAIEGTALLLAILAGFLFFIGFLGTFMPVIPGPPLAWGGILLAYFSAMCNISTGVLIGTGIAAAAVTVIDNIAPAWCTKKAGGSKPAVIGSTVGLIIGIFINPVFIIIGPFLGALVGELAFTDHKTEDALKAAFGAFLGFLLGTGIKLITVVIFIWIFVKSFVQ